MPDEMNNPMAGDADELQSTSPQIQDEKSDVIADELERLADDFGDIVDSLEIQTAQWRRQKGGERLGELLKSKEETLRCIDDADPAIRELAIHLSMDHWRIPGEIIGHCERVAARDPSALVRSLAFSVLGRYYRNQSNPRIGAMLATVVADPSVSLDERKSAYLSLVLVDGARYQASIPEIILRFPASVDWNTVNRYLIGHI